MRTIQTGVVTTCILLIILVVGIDAALILEEQQFLKDFYNSNQPFPESLSNWANVNNEASDGCSYTGIQCIDINGGAEQSISVFDLNYHGLPGTLPSQINLTNVESFYVSFNSLSGGIPTSLCDSTKLKDIKLEHNAFSGGIPSCFGNMPVLESLTMGDNSFSGNIPSELGESTSLKKLSLNHNQLDGAIPIELGQITTLEILQIQENQLTGSLPSELSTLVNLKIFEWWWNKITGELPSSYGSLTEMVKFYGGSHDPAYYMTGQIPASYAAWTKIETFSIGFEKLDGSLPSFVATAWVNLVSFDVTGNSFSGSLPNFGANQPELAVLKLDRNAFTGDLPASLGQATKLEELSASYNQFTGGLPDFTNCINLKTIDLSFNSLSELPGSSLNAAAIEKFIIHHNKFPNMTLPIYFGSISTLKELSIGFNNFTGIPSFSGATNLEIFDGSNTYIGSIPNSFGAPKLKKFYFSSTRINKPLPATFFSASPLLVEVDIAASGISGQFPFDSLPKSTLTHLKIFLNALEGSLNKLSEFTALREFQGQSTRYAALPDDLSNSKIINFIMDSCLLEGTLQPQQIPPGVVAFVIRDNYMEGELPDFSSYVNMTHLFIWSNRFHGDLPKLPPKIEQFVANRNQFNGSFDSNFPLPQSIQQIDVGTNFFKGQIPDLSVYPNLKKVELNYNKFEGPIPKLPTDLEFLSLQFNKLNGSIDSIWELPKLTYINIGHNNFDSGPIPSSFACNQTLQRLYLPEINRVGAIPQFLGTLNLTELDLNDNQLTSYPSNLANLKSLQVLGIGGNPFPAGPIPQWIGELPKLQTLQIYDANFNGRIPVNLANLTLVTFHAQGNQLECPDLGDDVNKTLSINKLKYCDFTGNKLCNTSNQLYTPACKYFFVGNLGQDEAECKVTPCFDDSVYQPIPTQNEMHEFNFGNGQIFYLPSVPTVPFIGLRVLNESAHEILNLNVSVIEVFEAATLRNPGDFETPSLAFYTGLAVDIGNFYNLSDLDWSLEISKFSTPTENDIPNIRYSAVTNEGVKITVHMFLFKNESQIYVYDREYTTLPNSLKLTISIDNWQREMRYGRAGFHAIGTTLIAKSSEDAIYEPTPSGDITITYVESEISGILRFPPLIQTDHRNSLWGGIGLVPPFSFDQLFIPQSVLKFRAYFFEANRQVSYDPDLSILFTSVQPPLDPPSLSNPSVSPTQNVVDGGSNTIGIAVGVVVGVVIIAAGVFIALVKFVPAIGDKVLPGRAAKRSMERQSKLVEMRQTQEANQRNTN